MAVVFPFPLPASGFPQAPYVQADLDTLKDAINNGTSLVTSITGTANQITASASTGAVTLSLPSSISLAGTTNQLVLGTTRTVTLTAPTPASLSRVITFPDLVGDYSVVGTIGAQTIAGVKTFSSGVAITATSAHLVLSTSSNTATLQASAQATSPRTFSIPDIAGNGTFALLEGTQTFSGDKTFSGVVAHTNGSTTALTVGTNFYVDATNHRVGVGLAPLSTLTVSDSNMLSSMNVTVSVGNNAVGTLTTYAKTNGIFTAIVMTQSDTSLSGIAQGRTGGGPTIVKIGGGANFDVSTAVLTGTTGTAGHVTLSSSASAIQIENRTGGTVTFFITTFSGS